MLGLEKTNRYEQYHDFDLLLGGPWEAQLTYCTGRRWYAVLFFRPGEHAERRDVLEVQGTDPRKLLSQLIHMNNCPICTLNPLFCDKCK